MRRRSAAIGMLLGFAPAFASAQQPASPAGIQLIPTNGILAPGCNFITGEFHYHCFPIYIGFLIQVAFAFAMGTCLFELVRAGYEYAFSGLGGDAEGPKKRIRNAVIGLAVSVLAFLIVNTVVTNLLSGPSS